MVNFTWNKNLGDIRPWLWPWELLSLFWIKNHVGPIT